MKYNPYAVSDIDWFHKCDECGDKVGEDQLICDEDGKAYCEACLPE